MKDYQSEEWAHMIAHAKKSLDSSCPLIEDEVLVAVGDELKQLRADNKALRDYVASLINTLPKLKADAVREFLDSVNDTNKLSTRDMQFLSKFACLYFEGEE